MALRIDYVKRTIALSAADLLGGRTRRIGYDRGDTFERLWIGQAVHRRVQGDALASVPGYEIERVVKLTFPVDAFTVTFEGRLDGRYEENGRVVVDEVKSLHFEKDLAKLAGSPRLTRFELQLRWYLLAVAETEGKPVEGRLVLADIESGATRVHPVALDAAATKGDLLRRVRALLAELDEAQALAEAKAAEAETLTFPFASYRPGQRELEAAVARAAANGDHLLVEAPTGIGKTAATLVPLVVEALRSGKRLYVLTSKTTQQEIFTRTLEAMGGDAYRSVRLRAKERMCANDVVLCHEDHCAYARDYGAKMAESALLDRLMAARARLEPDFVFEEARREAVCPFEVSLELSEVADVVVGDYNYVFDPVVSLSATKEPESLAGSILLIDEAHNLVDRGRGYYSPELVDAELALLADRIGLSSARTAPEALDALREVRALVADVAEAAGLSGPEAADLAAPPLDRLDEIRLSLESLLVRHLADMRDGGERVPDDPVLELYFRFARFHDVCRLALPDEGPDPAFDVLASRGRDGLRLSILCKDPSKLLGRTLNAAATVVAMSATLSPHEFYRDLLGLDPERTAILRLPSPFPRENREVLVVPSVDTSYSSRAASVPRIAALVADVARACPGNVLALFPSYRFLDDVLNRLPPLAGRRVVRPSDRSTELERSNVLESLKDRGAPIVLFAVSGGAFAEGVDYPGEMLQGVVVVSPALPQVRFEQERMRLYYDERFEKGFEYAYVIPGMTRVVQSAGRLIRSETDTGVVVLACRRFLKNPYRRHLPADWYLDDPDELSCVDVGARVAAFFERNRVREATRAETKAAKKEAASLG